MPVYVKMVHSMTAAWGGDSACVVDQAKQWTFDGDGLMASGSTDLIKFVVDDTDCASSSDAPLTGADLDGVAMYLEADSTSTFTFESAVAGQFLNLCYKFGNEEFMWYDIQAFAHMVQFVESQVGGNDIAVVDIEEVLVIQAYGTSSQDFMRWVASSETSDVACSDGILVRDSPDEGANNITDVSIYDEEGYFLASFTFSAFSAGSSPTLCYKFAGVCVCVAGFPVFTALYTPFELWTRSAHVQNTYQGVQYSRVNRFVGLVVFLFPSKMDGSTDVT